MAGAIPALLGRVPVDVASQMRAHARPDVQRAVAVAACRQPLQAVDEDAALAGLQRLDGLELARQQVLCEILDRRHVLADVGADRLGGLARRIVDAFPRARARHDQVPEEQAGQGAVRDPLARIAGRHEDPLVVRVAADIAAMVQRRHDLARPAVRLLAELRYQLADPGFELAEPFGAVIGLARLVVLAARDQVVALAGTGMETDVVVGIGHVPVERIRQRVAGDAERHGVGAVGRHLAVQLDAFVDGRVGGDDGMARRDTGAVLRVHLDALRRGLDADHRAVGEHLAAFIHDRAGYWPAGISGDGTLPGADSATPVRS